MGFPEQSLYSKFREIDVYSKLERELQSLSDDDVKVRKEAIESLVGITDEEAIEPLIKATTDDNAQVRFKAAEILGSMGDVAVDKLIDEFKNAEGKTFCIFCIFACLFIKVP